MKTLNRTLSLTLVFALVFSLMSFAFAAPTATTTTTGYKDAADVTYKEAVDVTSAIGVFQGNDSNAFAPKDNLTREQAAKVICYLTMGKAAADKLTTASAPFTDVPAARWSAGSIAYCQQQGIIAGYGDGKFGPTDTVTGYQFAKMLLVSLGYDAVIQSYNGNNWSINVAKDAFANKLFAGNSAFIGINPATREEAALYVLNTLQADMVTYDTKGTEIKLPDGTTIRQGASAPKQTAGNTFKNNFYPTLKVTNGTDVFGRNANTWTLKGVEIGTYATAASIVITEAQDANDLAKLLKGYSVKSGATYSVNGTTGTAIVGGTAVNGIMPADSTTFAQLAPLTGNGVKVEVFVDNDNAKVITGISVIKTDLTLVKNVNTTAKTVSLVIASKGGVKAPGVPFTVKASDNETLYESLKVMPIDTPVLVTLNTTDNGTNYSVVSATLPKAVTGKITATTGATDATTGMTINGTAYKAAAAKTDAVAGAKADTKNDATILLDSFGYVVHYKGVTANANHAYVLDTYQVLSNSRITNMAKIVLSDGTIVDVANGTAGLDKGQTKKITATTPAYTFADDVNTIKAVSAEIKATQKSIDSSYFASDVKFVFVNSTAKTATVKNGVQNVPTYGANSKYVLGPASASDPTLVIKAVYIVDGATAETSSIAYFQSKDVKGYVTVKAADGTDVTVPTYDGYINGELVEKMPIAVLPTDGILDNEFYTCIKNENGSYSLGNVAYVGSAPGAVAVKGASISSIAVNKYVTLGSATVDLTNAVFVDTRDVSAKIDSLYALNAFVGAGNTVTADVLYNGANSNAVAVYIKSVAVTKFAITKPADTTATGNEGTYSFTVAPASAVKDDNVTVTVTCKTVTATGKTDTVTIKNGATVLGTATFAEGTDIIGATKNVTFKMPANAALTLSASVAQA